MTFFMFGLIGVIILALTKRIINPVPVLVSMASNAQFYSQCGAGLEEQMDILFPERRTGELRNSPKKSVGAKVKKGWSIANYFEMFGRGIKDYLGDFIWHR